MYTTNDDDLIKNPVYPSTQARNIPATKRLSMQLTSLPFLDGIPHKVPKNEWL